MLYMVKVYRQTRWGRSATAIAIDYMPTLDDAKNRLAELCKQFRVDPSFYARGEVWTDGKCVHNNY